ncbi:MAG: hypothetical protein E6I27_08390 [Chloroflexi bacterium]|nr:MAG: hypothetical protein E6I27_08390 [Chloroflexota bacterium]
MWKTVGDALVEAFAAADRIAYMYYLQAKRETELQVQATRSSLPSRQARPRPADGALHARQEASA